MVATKTSVISGLSELYHVDTATAENILKYDSAIRGKLNRMHAVAQVADAVELERGAASETTGVIAQALEAIPVFGGIAGLVGYGINRGAQAAERHFKLGEAAKIKDMNPSGDPKEWAEFTKDLARGFVEQKSWQFKGKSEEEIKEIAEKDSAKVAEMMLSGRASGIYSENITEILDEVLERPQRSPSGGIKATQLAPQQNRGVEAGA